MSTPGFNQSHEIRLGLTDSLSVGLGVFPLGIALGFLIVQSGLPWWLAPALTIGIFAGSVELLMVSMLTSGVSLVTIALTTLAVNFRHVFYAFSFPLHRVKPGLGRAYSVYAMIDEAYATYAGKPVASLSSARILAMQIATQLYWVIGSLLGVAIANVLPEPIAGFEFALCALFTVMTLDAFRSSAEVPSALFAVTAVAVAVFVASEQVLLVALLIFASLLVLRFVLTPKDRLPSFRDAVAEGETAL